MTSKRRLHGKRKFSRVDLIDAMKMRLRGVRLVEISKITGIERSYISKLFNASFNCTGWRYRELPDKLRLEVLKAALKKYEKHVERLKAEVVLLELETRAKNGGVQGIQSTQ